MPNNWRTARFDGSRHLDGCDKLADCHCSARMAAYWNRERDTVEALCAAADGQAPVTADGAPVSLMAEAPTVKVAAVTNHELVYGEGAGL